MNQYDFKTIYESSIADIVTPVGLYSKLRNKYVNTLLLESSDYHSKEESFSIICINPLLTLRADNGYFTTFLKNEEIKSEKIDKNFNQLFSEFKNNIKTEIKNDEISRFNGLYGYIAYDAIQYFEKIELNAPLAKSNVPNIQFSFFQFVILINHFKDELTIIENIEEGEVSEMHEIMNIFKPSALGLYSFSIKGDESSNITDDLFKKNVTSAKDHCKKGDVFQLVLSRQFQQPFNGDDFNVYRTLRSINPSPYLFYFDYDNFKLIGSSPEAQIKVDSEKATINPIAGTYKRTGNLQNDIKQSEELSKDEKENAEHVMLVDLARNDLSKHASNVKVDVYKEIQFFSHVIHLVSTVSGESKGKAIDIVSDTFPAGTLSGAPKYRAIQLIDQYENQKRGFYGGAVGYIGLDNTVNLAIAIRSFVSKNNTLYYQAGAGVVIDSDEESELQEVNNKLRALRKAILKAEKI